ncbi:23S rRNA (adenine(1618)-N(6))-methyltransferase RlmF [Shewanella canadensis]|uniref:Ribosomal RNA large subunit methyltransferase F n=1 Tax=Shewanella canadensis TaxID=271096 RepID=A0A431WPD8_9GAMM|nr:23S rRNA (adenine(1618)-N(6))-methyltransferase RlmF [Shewanella canadensis]RTR37317.1 23S rRNA (adenine(1618)-N(6))-methyltransferase RlmF [Shewanella canadensis]
MTKPTQKQNSKKPITQKLARRKKPAGKRQAKPEANLDTRGKTETTTEKKGLHERNLHRDGYDFEKLIEATPALKSYVRPNPYGNLSIDFADPLAVKALNLALLQLHYRVKYWDIPAGFLCPPIPGRVDYLHYVADLLAGVDSNILEDKSDEPKAGQNVPYASSPKPKPQKKMKINALDIGTGANGIYPILGIQAYGWRFVASDVDPLSIENVNRIVGQNKALQGKLKTRLQTDHQKVFHGIIYADDRFDITLCNPPFHGSLSEASEGSLRKVKNLAANRAAKGHKPEPAGSEKLPANELNFGGQKAELWCVGGEKLFLSNMIRESKDFATQCLWFTSLVSKKENLQPCYAALEKAGAVTVKTIDMAQGNKLTRVLAWSFLTPSQRDLWAKYRG